MDLPSGSGARECDHRPVILNPAGMNSGRRLPSLKYNCHKVTTMYGIQEAGKHITVPPFQFPGFLRLPEGKHVC